MKRIQATVFALTLVVCHAVWSATSPVPMLEQAANRILNTLSKNKFSLKSNPKIIYNAVEKHLLPKVDITGMSRSVLGRQAWMKASTSERKAFTRAFTRLVIRTYASPLAEYSNETVRFLPVRGKVDGRFVRVNSIIVRPNGKNIPLSYSLVAKKGQWKIYDLSVEGVSLLQSFRSQFAQELQNSSIQGLINKLEKKAKG